MHQKPAYSDSSILCATVNEVSEISVSIACIFFGYVCFGNLALFYARIYLQGYLQTKRM